MFDLRPFKCVCVCVYACVCAEIAAAAAAAEVESLSFVCSVPPVEVL